VICCIIFNIKSHCIAVWIVCVSQGLDYPNVNLVVQYGLPSSRDLYLHRLGRTARSGNHGRGLLVALPFEQVSHVVAAVKKSCSRNNKRHDGQPPPQSSIVQDEELTRLVESSLDDWREELESIQKQMKDAAAAVSMTDSSSGGGGGDRRRRSRNAAQPNYSPLGPAALAAYSSFVAYYVEHAPRRGVSMSEIRQASEAFGRGALGLVHFPELPTTLADKLGAGD
jgi:superfamily II DNA/RNA helicase